MTSASHRTKLLVWARVVFSQNLFTAFSEINPFINMLPPICVQAMIVGYCSIMGKSRSRLVIAVTHSTMKFCPIALSGLRKGSTYKKTVNTKKYNNDNKRGVFRELHEVQQDVLYDSHRA